MEAMDMVQVRTAKNIKIQANNILDKLGLNMSTYVNMALKQLIIQGGIPFSVMLRPSVYTAGEQISEVKASLDMEGMRLTQKDINMLNLIQNGELTTEDARALIFAEVQDG